ncbi:hypothetical protein AKO1_004065 [Acrasis kona]|uniref:STAS domain-containing protein n=1 Tax=Acrasis kona TaxID=1008807 RepID=A0AAW2YX66_9EUKA
MGVGCIIVILLLQYCHVPFRGKKYYISSFLPVSLIMIILLISIMAIVRSSLQYPFNNKDIAGIKIVGSVPSGFPAPSIPLFYPDDFVMNITTNSTNVAVNGTVVDYSRFRVPISGNKLLQVFLNAWPLVFVGFAESISMAKYYGGKDGYRVDSNQELIAVGASCMVGGFFSGYVSTGSFSRSALGHATGCASCFSSLLTGLIMFVVIYVATPAFYYLPKPLLGAIVICTVLKVVDIHMVIYCYLTRYSELFVLLFSFFCTLFTGPEIGIVSAAGMSLALFIFRASRPRFVVMGRIPGTTLYRNVKYWPNAVVVPGVLVVRFDSELFFGNTVYFADNLKLFVEKAKLQTIDGVNNKTRVIVMDMSSVDHVDTSALQSMIEMHDLLTKNKILWYFANTREEIFKTLQAGWIVKEERVPAHHFFRHVHPAVQAASNILKSEYLVSEVKPDQEIEKNDEGTHAELLTDNLHETQ